MVLVRKERYEASSATVGSNSKPALLICSLTSSVVTCALATAPIIVPAVTFSPDSALPIEAAITFLISGYSSKKGISLIAPGTPIGPGTPAVPPLTVVVFGSIVASIYPSPALTPA